MNDVLSKIGSSFIVAGFVPALAFVTLAMVVFTPIIPPPVLELIKTPFLPVQGPTGIVLLVFTIVLGFTLFSLNTYIYKLYEGYFILELFPWINQFQRRKAQRKLLKIKLLERLLQNENFATQNAQLRERILALRFQESARFHLDYPPNARLILPTRFGNIFRSIETYSGSRYMMDAVLTWPRLIHVIPDAYYQKLDQNNNRLGFLVNCYVLSLLMTGMVAFASIYQFLLAWLAQRKVTELLYFIPIDTSAAEKYTQNAFIYLAGIIISMCSFVVFYRASLPVANHYGNLVRSAFDLFRPQLMRVLRLQQPKEYLDELEIWRDFSHFIDLADTIRDKEYLFNYDVFGKE